MKSFAFGLGVVLALRGPLVSLGQNTVDESDTTGTTVVGTVLIDGAISDPMEWALEDAMRRVTGEEVYREETWLVGENKGLANCVVSLTNKVRAAQVVPKPVENAVMDKVGVRYVPRVLVVTPGTEVLLRNKESPCHGFSVAGRYHGDLNYLIAPGSERRATMGRPDICSVTCGVRPYVVGYIHVVKTPYFAVTNAEGQFKISGVPAGDYRLVVWHERAGKLGKEAGPREVTVTGKGETELNFQVKIPDEISK